VFAQKAPEIRPPGSVLEVFGKVCCVFTYFFFYGQTPYLKRFVYVFSLPFQRNDPVRETLVFETQISKNIIRIDLHLLVVLQSVYHLIWRDINTSLFGSASYSRISNPKFPTQSFFGLLAKLVFSGSVHLKYPFRSLSQRTCLYRSDIYPTRPSPLVHLVTTSSDLLFAIGVAFRCVFTMSRKKKRYEHRRQRR